MAATILVVVIVVALLAILAVTGKTGFDSLIALLGVVAGVAISEISRHRSGELDREHQLRMAALEKRLQAHQEGYALWRRLMFDAHDFNQAGKTAGECQEWWEKNCLFLEPRARQAFNRALLTAATFPATKQTRDTALIKAEFATILEAGDALVDGVALPRIAGGEDSTIKRPDSSDA
jgi:hypothetical protein